MKNDIKRSVINALKKNNPAILKHPNFSNYLMEIRVILLRRRLLPVLLKRWRWH